jgi:hypothetical protein
MSTAKRAGTQPPALPSSTSRAAAAARAVVAIDGSRSMLAARPPPS